MTKRKLPNKPQLMKALVRFDGNMAATSRYFGCHRSAVRLHVVNDEELRDLVDELQESFTDEAESQLFKLIREGNPAAVIFYLKTRARDRGYSEKFEFTAITQHAIEVDLGIPREDDPVDAIDTDFTPTALLEQ